MAPRYVLDRCPCCEQRIRIELVDVVVVYSREAERPDVYQWSHAVCGVIVKPYTPDVAELFAPYLGAKGIRAMFRDAEFDDPARRAELPAFTDGDVAALVKRLEGLPSARK